MNNYRLYIDLSGGQNQSGYFEITAVSNDVFNESRINKMPVLRNEWGTVKVKNYPYEYATLGGSRYNLYDILSSVHPTNQINIKFVSDIETIYGYFGIVDCELSDDKSTIEIKPTILDQYTPFIENYDKEINTFEGRNVIINGDFRSFDGNNPIGWTKTTPATETYPTYFKDKSSVRIPSVIDILGNTGLNQTFTGVNKGKNISIQLQFLLIGTTSTPENLKFKCHLQGTSNDYDLTESGKWIGYDANYKAIYKKGAIPLDSSSVNEYFSFLLTSESIPESGTITFYLFHEPGFVSDLYFSKVKVELFNIELKTIKVNLDEETLITVNQEKTGIDGIREDYFDFYFRTPDGTRNWDSSLFDCDNYFSPDGTPNQGYLSSGDTALKSLKKLTYNDLIDIMDNDQNSSFYQGEMSELTVLRGMYFRKNLIRRRMFYGQAKFTREEVYISDSVDENNNLVPPETNVGWKSTQTINSKGLRLWVRKPYNGSISTWTLGTKEELGEGTYHAKITSKRNYPVLTSQTTEYNTGVDLRDFLTQIYQATDDSLVGKQVISTFFWNDSQTEEIENKVFADGVTTSNYVSGVNPNPLNNIMVLHTSDLSTTAALDEEKSVLKISGNETFDDFKIFFPKLYFYIDEDYNLHIEHEKFFEKTRTFKNITSSKYDYIPDYRQFSFIREEMFSLEKYSIANSGYQDFKYSDIAFEKIVSNKRKEDIKLEVTTKKITTDIQYCIENANSLDNGIILAAYDVVGGENIVRHSKGQKTGKSVLNGDLSISSLLYEYARYSGTWKTGQINGNQYPFENTTWTKKGTEITLKGIITENEIKTLIGNGIVISKEKDYDNEQTKVTLVYQFDVVELSNGNGEIIDTGNGNNVVLLAATVITGEVNVYELASQWNIIVNSSVTDDGDSSVTEKGICFGASLNPTTADTKSIGFPSTGVGSYIAGYANLSSGTYYLRAYAINGVTTAYGDNKTFVIP